MNFSLVAVIGPIEYWSKKNGTNAIFSEQNLLDCVLSNQGLEIFVLIIVVPLNNQNLSTRCDGGDLESAYAFMVANGVTESSIYRNIGTAQSCQSSQFPATYWLPNAGNALLGGNEEMLKNMLFKYGPLSIGISKNHQIVNKLLLTYALLNRCA